MPHLANVMSSILKSFANNLKIVLVVSGTGNRVFVFTILLIPKGTTPLIPLDICSFAFDFSGRFNFSGDWPAFVIKLWLIRSIVWVYARVVWDFGVKSLVSSLISKIYIVLAEEKRLSIWKSYQLKRDSSFLAKVRLLTP